VGRLRRRVSLRDFHMRPLGGPIKRPEGCRLWETPAPVSAGLPGRRLPPNSCGHPRRRSVLDEGPPNPARLGIIRRRRRRSALAIGPTCKLPWLPSCDPCAAGRVLCAALVFLVPRLSALLPSLLMESEGGARRDEASQCSVSTVPKHARSSGLGALASLSRRPLLSRRWPLSPLPRRPPASPSPGSILKRWSWRAGSSHSATSGSRPR
jgi:hypothetical protein